MRKILLLLFALTSVLGAASEDELATKMRQVLSSLVRDVLLSDSHEGSRKFYGTDGDKSVLLLNGSGIGGEPAVWPDGFVPKLEGFTFVFGHPQAREIRRDYTKYGEWSAKHNRMLAIRLDRLNLDPRNGSDKTAHLFDRCAVRISIQTGGGHKNGAVIGGKTTWYDIKEEAGGTWVVVQKGAVD